MKMKTPPLALGILEREIVRQIIKIAADSPAAQAAPATTANNNTGWLADAAGKPKRWPFDPAHNGAAEARVIAHNALKPYGAQLTAGAAQLGNLPQRAITAAGEAVGARSKPGNSGYGLPSGYAAALKAQQETANGMSFAEWQKNPVGPPPAFDPNAYPAPTWQQNVLRPFLPTTHVQPRFQHQDAVKQYYGDVRNRLNGVNPSPLGAMLGYENQHNPQDLAAAHDFIAQQAGPAYHTGIPGGGFFAMPGPAGTPTTLTNTVRALPKAVAVGGGLVGLSALAPTAADAIIPPPNSANTAPAAADPAAWGAAPPQGPLNPQQQPAQQPPAQAGNNAGPAGANGAQQPAQTQQSVGGQQQPAPPSAEQLQQHHDTAAQSLQAAAAPNATPEVKAQAGQHVQDFIQAQAAAHPEYAEGAKALAAGDVKNPAAIKFREHLNNVGSDVIDAKLKELYGTVPNPTPEQAGGFMAQAENFWTNLPYHAQLMVGLGLPLGLVGLASTVFGGGGLGGLVLGALGLGAAGIAGANSGAFGDDVRKMVGQFGLSMMGDSAPQFKDVDPKAVTAEIEAAFKAGGRPAAQTVLDKYRGQVSDQLATAGKYDNDTLVTGILGKGLANTSEEAADYLKQRRAAGQQFLDSSANPDALFREHLQPKLREQLSQLDGRHGGAISKLLEARAAQTDPSKRNWSNLWTRLTNPSRETQILDAVKKNPEYARYLTRGPDGQLQLPAGTTLEELADNAITNAGVAPVERKKTGAAAMNIAQRILIKTAMLKAARCWAGYEPVPGTKAYSEGSCRPKGSKKTQKEVINGKQHTEKKADRSGSIQIGAHTAPDRTAYGAAMTPQMMQDLVPILQRHPRYRNADLSNPNVVHGAMRSLLKTPGLDPELRNDINMATGARGPYAALTNVPRRMQNQPAPQPQPQPQQQQQQPVQPQLPAQPAPQPLAQPALPPAGRPGMVQMNKETAQMNKLPVPPPPPRVPIAAPPINTQVPPLPAPAGSVAGRRG